VDFSGRTAVVTGAASGMGKATAIGFGTAGANVALVDLDEGGAKQVAEAIDPTGKRVMLCPVDLADTSAVRETLEAVRAHFGRLDALANVAAIYPPTNPDVSAANALEVTEEYWDRLLSVNLRGVFFCCQAAIRIMIEQGSGAIVNVASGAAFRPIQGMATYSASKAGLVGMSRVLALECARKGVRVNIMAPGHTYTEGNLKYLSKEEWDAIGATLVPGRLMDPEEPANAIIWLCSDEASGVNGAIINVNGGNHMPQG
jgi:NAD(P)-dependent dehydrogenase (short-subunit alcohol dehydrogenase family)